MADGPGPVALVGSGEYLPVMESLEQRLLDRRPPRFVQLATAAAPEGAESLARWHELGRQSAERLGVEQVIVPVVDRESADDPALAAMVEGAGLIYLSGGNPEFLATTLRETAVWQAISTAWHGGAALAGCSAGAMAMASSVPNIRNRSPRVRGRMPSLLKSPTAGLGVTPQLSVIPHFDRFAARMPDGILNAITNAPAGVTVVGVDEETALLGGPDNWEVVGRQKVWVLTSRGRQGYAAGERLTLPR
jgi:cyanophycinase